MKTILVSAGLFATLFLAASEPIGSQIERCWSTPSAVAGSRFIVEFEIEESGELAAIPQSPQTTAADEAVRKGAEAAVRAVRRCAPYNAPAGQYRLMLPPADADMPTRV